MAEYNGWTNKQTWLVALWIDNDGYAGGADAVAERAQEIVDEEGKDGDAIRRLADHIRESIEENIAQEAPYPSASLTSDIVGHAMALVDWEEIAGHYVDAAEGEEDEGEEVDA